MTRNTMIGILVACAAILISLVATEFSIRFLGNTDANGQFYLGDIKLPPYALPLDKLELRIQEYLDNKDKVTLLPDAETGWTYRPNSKRQNGEFTINGAGLRAQREYDLAPAPDTLRIALFGDSFVAGDEVKDDEVWGSALERMLNGAGLRAEALNFGVGGYGMDQAFLRWQSKGRDFSPDIVMFAFQPENLNRNVNVFRRLYGQGGTYSKPRFILDGGDLTLVNSPALPPEEMMEAYRSFDSHPLAVYEAYYQGRYSSSPLVKASKLAGFAYAVLKPLREAATLQQGYGPESERGQLGKAIVDAFAADVQSSGATFMVLHLPLMDHLRDFHAGNSLPWRHLLDYLQDSYHFINAEDFLGPEYTDRAYYQPRNHYGPEINAIIAEALSAELLACIQAGSCKLSRFDDISEIMR